MAKFYDHLEPQLIEFIEAQKMFFTGTAAQDGRVNVSPKGSDSLRVLSPNKIAWLNLTGSGNETAAHLKLANRITLMFCAFEGKPLILRVYGSAKTIHQQDTEWGEYIDQFDSLPGARNIFIVEIESVQTSCGFAVPYMDYKEDREILNDWVVKKSEAELKDYWTNKNVESIDGYPTGIFD
ncbi:pyridoxamine 5'-phosphate oxidase family protein [Roseivirga sp. E12]|uniref:pyridoxamine 5'-phosphate oxidase family protein n=1 Tax=Roseivirga sp. E12 TaxID=2819237 RepID=UPI001ABC7622|nr:pyridoxamine 5'-phosphate oxidase family protein [Roseivirga sp. E12]MBO3700682.1 pyridoxamine 5'-phosphate oxidase family protein [Roseivirga sp. E12]